MNTRIVLVDDSGWIRKMQRRVLEGESDFQIVGEAVNGREAVELVGRLRPDVVIMDINMPEVSGIEATRIIHQGCPEIRIIACSSHSSQLVVESILTAGASGYVLKGSIGHELIKAIKVAIRDDIYLDPQPGDGLSTVAQPLMA